MPRRGYVPDHDNLGGSNRLLTLPEAADYIRAHPETLRKHRGRWGIPAVRMGKHLVFRERDLKAFIERRFAA
jgi:excisionase family DNA binding protein